TIGELHRHVLVRPGLPNQPESKCWEGVGPVIARWRVTSLPISQRSEPTTKTPRSHKDTKKTTFVPLCDLCDFVVGSSNRNWTRPGASPRFGLRDFGRQD